MDSCASPAIVEYHATGGTSDDDDRSSPNDDQEGHLHGVISACVAGLGSSLEQAEDPATRTAILEALFRVYQDDIDSGGIGLADDAPEMLIEQTTPDERRMLAEWVRTAIAAPGREYGRNVYGGLLLDLEAETLDDETFLRICRETGRAFDLVDRLLELERLEEAIAAAKEESDYNLLQLADTFAGREHDAVAERLIRERAAVSQDARLKEWLKKRAVGQGDLNAALELAHELFRGRPHLGGYQEEIERLIEARGRGNYQDACELLLRVRGLFERLDEQSTWRRYLDGLRERYRNLRALRDEMDAVGLRE